MGVFINNTFDSVEIIGDPESLNALGEAMLFKAKAKERSVMRILGGERPIEILTNKDVSDRVDMEMTDYPPA